MNEYIFPDDIYTNPGKFVSIFERFDRLCFVGHTHVPGVFLEGPDFYSPDELDYKFELTDEKAIINVGSVGQPRDRDPRSSFVVVTDTYVEFVRLAYDVESRRQQGGGDPRPGQLPRHPAAGRKVSPVHHPITPSDHAVAPSDRIPGTRGRFPDSSDPSWITSGPSS